MALLISVNAQGLVGPASAFQTGALDAGSGCECQGARSWAGHAAFIRPLSVLFSHTRAVPVYADRNLGYDSCLFKARPETELSSLYLSMYSQLSSLSFFFLFPTQKRCFVKHHPKGEYKDNQGTVLVFLF